MHRAETSNVRSICGKSTGVLTIDVGNSLGHPFEESPSVWSLDLEFGRHYRTVGQTRTGEHIS